MCRALLLMLFFFVLTTLLFATTEAEPNNTQNDTSVLWCDNGTHNGNFNYPGDVDYWFFYGFPGDVVTFSTLGQSTMDTILEIRDEAGVVVASNDDYESSVQSLVTYTVPDDNTYYVVVKEYYNNPGAYGLAASGEFISYYGIPNVPYNINIPDGATGVDPNTDLLSWSWGDGCCLGMWSLYFGSSPTGMQPLNMFPNTVETRLDSITLPAPFMGGYTYYYRFFITLNGVQYATSVYSFTTAPVYLPVPFTENFNLPAYMFGTVSDDNPWQYAPVDEANPGAMITICNAGSTSLLIESGTHDLSVTNGAYMTFSQLGLLEAEQDHGYVEYSTDGGATWAIFPASAYLGAGIYDTPTSNNPEGPCFDMGSYAPWGSYTSGSPIADLWRTETFDLSPWAGSTAFRVRFRSVCDNDNVGFAWAVDNFTIQLNPASVPSVPFPATTSIENNTNLALTWQGTGATSYDIAFGTNPAALTVYNTTIPSWNALNLTPYTTYYWKVRSRNAYGTTVWSALWSFTTQQYATPWHQNSPLFINRVQFGTINNLTAWNGYTNYSALSTVAQCGINLPISVYLTGGTGPEGVRVWVDTNRDAVFNNTPGGGEYWDIPWGSGCFQGNIFLPSNLSASPTRMRVQAIHTTTDVLVPSGIFQYGETEDYLLLTADNPILTVTPTSATFPSTLVGFASSPTRFTFTNTGGQSLDITLTGITGPNSSSFTLTEGNAYPIHLTNNAASVDIRFLPQTLGTHNAYLLVRDNLSRTDQTYALSGTAIGSRPDGALTFDGSGEYVNVASGAPLQSLTKVTLETWFKWDGGSAIQFLTSKNMEELEIHTNGNNSSLRFIPTTGVYIDSQNGVLHTGQWQHIACVYDPAAGLGKIYIDGQDVTWQNNGSNPLTTPLQSTPSSFRMGIRQGGTYPLAGSLDEVRIWNTARTASEINSNMHFLQTAGTPGLTANWRLDELSGNIAYDQIHSLHGDLVNMEAGDHTQSTVAFVSGLISPQNVTISRPGADIRLQWNAVSGATGYKVYSAGNPEGPFLLNSTGSFSGTVWTAPAPAGKLFYKVTTSRE